MSGVFRSSSDTDNDGTNEFEIKGSTDGTNIGNVSDSLKTSITNSSLAITAASLPLPTGAATSANQSTIISSLSSIDAGIPAALGQTTMANSMPVVIASNQSSIPVTISASTTISSVSGIIKLVYNDMDAGTGGVARDTSISTTYVTIYNYSGTGSIFGFLVTLEGNLGGADAFLLKLTVDSLVVAEISTLDLGTATLYNLLSDGDANFFGWQSNGNTILFKTPVQGGLRYASSVKIEIKKVSGATKKFRAGLIGLTKE